MLAGRRWMLTVRGAFLPRLALVFVSHRGRSVLSEGDPQ